MNGPIYYTNRDVLGDVSNWAKQAIAASDSSGLVMLSNVLRDLHFHASDIRLSGEMTLDDMVSMSNDVKLVVAYMNAIDMFDEIRAILGELQIPLGKMFSEQLEILCGILDSGGGDDR